MICDEFRDRLDAYVDGLLAPGDREAVERHLASCADCRADLGATRAVRSRVRTLPRQVEPAADLWSGIAARLPARSLARLVSLPAWGLLAAAVVLIGLTSAVTGLVRRPARSGAGEGSSVRLVSVQDYDRDITQLLAVYQRMRDSLAPETQAVVERNLVVIDRALAEARAALDRDPANREVETLLLAAYRQKRELLQRAAELGRES